MIKTDTLKKAANVDIYAANKKLTKFNRSIKFNKQVRDLSQLDVALDESIAENEVQADWSETDDTKLSYIKNKPAGPMQLMGRYDTYAELVAAVTAPKKGWTYLIGASGSAEFEEYTCVDDTTGAIVWEKLGKTQVQADWSETDTTAMDYIKNKPTEATTSVAGFMSAADKTKLDGIAAGAEVNVQSDWNETASSSDAFILNKPTTMPNVEYMGAVSTSPDITLAANTFTFCNGNPTAIHIGNSEGFSSDKLNEVSGLFTTGTNTYCNFSVGSGSSTITWKGGDNPGETTSGSGTGSLSANSVYMFSVIGNPTIGFYGTYGKMGA